MISNEAAPPDPGIKPGGIRDRAMRWARRGLPEEWCRPDGVTCNIPSDMPTPDHTKIADRWKAQYCRNMVWRCCGDGKGSKQIYEELVALGSSPHPLAIEKIIGNDSWT